MNAFLFKVPMNSELSTILKAVPSGENEKARDDLSAIVTF